MMQMRFLGLSLFAIGLLAACSSSSGNGDGGSTPCNENPFECGAGQTCWPKDTALTFECLNSGAAKAGESCQNTPGSATCADGLACLQLSTAGGTCAAYCDSTNTAHACPSGQTCRTAVIGGPSGPQINVCVGGPTQNDAGAGSDASAVDSSAPEASTGD